MKTTLTVTVVTIMSLSVAAGAQTIPHEQQSRAAAEQQLQVLLEKTLQTGVRVAVEGRPVTGAPYSGEAVTESVQTLADGNRIVRKTTVRVYRDAAGRTRRETMDADGRVTGIVISDPAAGTSYLLDPETNTVRRTGMATLSVAGGGVVSHLSAEARAETEAAAVHFQTQQKVQQKTHATTEHAAVTVTGPITGVTEHTKVASRTSMEDLGQQTIEGVLATGGRTTTVLPAGAIGNEMPITVVSEEWFSRDLKVLVLTKHIDPRLGETTYRLTNISRAEPSPALFELPAGQIVK